MEKKERERKIRIEDFATFYKSKQSDGDTHFAQRRSLTPSCRSASSANEHPLDSLC